MKFTSELPAHLVMAFIVVVVAGCGGDVADNQPTYADLVVIYNAELETLDRLEKKKQELIEKHEAQQRPSAEDAVKALGDVLTTASELTREVDPDATFDPEAALDRAVDNAQNAQEVVSQLFDSVNQDPSDESEADAAKRTEATAAYEQQLAALNEEIEKQTKRVERARQARDAAESTQ